MDYDTTEVPNDYTCSVCKAHGCKLYRPAQNTSPLYCVDCALKNQSHKTDVGLTDDNAQHQIGWLLAAVPAEDEQSYWGFTSVPDRGCAWWKRLPIRAQMST